MEAEALIIFFCFFVKLPRICEVGQLPIWVKPQAEPAYSLLCVVNLCLRYNYNNFSHFLLQIDTNRLLNKTEVKEVYL